MKKRKILWLAVIPIIGIAAALPTNDKYFQIVKNLDIFATLYKEVNAYYVDDLNPSKVMRTGIDAMLASLDPYTNYIPEDDIENYRTSTTGEYAGIGALVDQKDGVSTIILAYEGFAADRAGLKIGDQILKINGVDLAGMTTDESRQLINGQAQSEITLTVRRFGQSEPFEVKLNREKIAVKNVPYFGMVNDEIGLVRLTDFTNKAGAEVRAAVLDLKEQGARKIILDLRGNPGGLLNEAVNICNVFIPQGLEVVTTRGKLEEWTQVYQTLNLPTDTDIPLAVLINNQSASASEIVSGVMQDYDRGVLIGRKSYGKGLVQQTRPLAYNSQLKVTTAKYYIPSGRCIQALDYSNRNPDGSVGKVADSLKSAFKTAAGRVVYDGGGVDPDVEVAKVDYAAITQGLLQNDLFFHYATDYYYSHDSIAHPKTFRLTDKEYSAFSAWVQNRKFRYQTDLEKQLEQLREVATTDPNFQTLQPAIKALEAKIDEAKRKDMDTYRVQIQMLLEQEIATRYYLERGMIESTFDKDPDILEAVQVLSDMNQYQSLLMR